MLTFAAQAATLALAKKTINRKNAGISELLIGFICQSPLFTFQTNSGRYVNSFDFLVRAL